MIKILANLANPDLIEDARADEAAFHARKLVGSQTSTTFSVTR